MKVSLLKIYDSNGIEFSQFVSSAASLLLFMIEKKKEKSKAVDVIGNSRP